MITHKICLCQSVVYFKNTAISNHISASRSRSNGLFDKSIKPPVAFNNSLAPALNRINTILRLCLFLMLDGIKIGKSVIIFSGSMCSSVHVDNKKKDILVLRKEPT